MSTAAKKRIQAALFFQSLTKGLTQEHLGLLLGFIGVLAFSLTLPMTRFAVHELDAWFVAFGRMAAAGLLAGLVLVLMQTPRPAPSDWWLLLGSAVGVVIGFPLLSSLAMRFIPAHQGAVVNGALPFATALAAALLFSERQSTRFWICAAAGSACVIAFALHDGGSFSLWGNACMAGAVVIGALGYACGGRLAARIGGVPAILWSLVIALPLTLPTTLLLIAQQTPQASPAVWGAFAYVTLISQLAGFFAWYNGLALASCHHHGGMGRVSQIQLLQVFFTISFAGWMFGEQVQSFTWWVASAVMLLIVVGRSGTQVVRPITS